jgi:hypothetical protein
MSDGGLVYLASPYSHVDPLVREERFHKACAAAARLMRSGCAVFSPIAHSHPVEQHFGGVVEGLDFWMKQDVAILRHCSRLVVLRLNGWERSKGIATETALAKQLGIPVEFIDE